MKIACVLVLAAISSTAAYADSLVTVRPAGTDSVHWSQLGAEFTTIPQNFTFTTANGVSGSGSLSGGDGQALTEDNGWHGNFSTGDNLIWTNGNGPLTLSFGSSYTEIGVQIASTEYGAFTAQICDANACFTEDGNSAFLSDNSAIYLGISSSIPISSVTISLTATANNTPSDFAINQVTLDGAAVSPVPEPSSLALLGTGLVSAMGLMRRRFARS